MDDARATFIDWGRNAHEAEVIPPGFPPGPPPPRPIANATPLRYGEIAPFYGIRPNEPYRAPLPEPPPEPPIEISDPLPVPTYGSTIPANWAFSPTEVYFATLAVIGVLPRDRRKAVTSLQIAQGANVDMQLVDDVLMRLLFEGKVKRVGEPLQRSARRFFATKRCERRQRYLLPERLRFSKVPPR